ncbi:MAG TPA: N-6 DNA methylase [Ktedonosporobacter sp.]|nr:N-6 DNA methylase [Ktedonosporobacter sp.]
MLSWYEATLPARERKKRGHFSTPPLLVEQILDACGYIPGNDLSRIRVLDPACGSGNFLAGVLRRLIASEKETGQKSLITSVQRNIWGLDPDPVACFLAEMQLRTILAEAVRPTLPARPFHIHQADGLALPWEGCENVDLFLANPPYLAAKNNDLSGYRSARGQTDSYLLFLRLALQVVRPGGWIGLVLPDPLLARSNAAKERQRLLAETTVHHLWHLASVFTAYVGAVVIVAQKRPPPHLHHIAWTREKWSTLSSVDRRSAAGPAEQGRGNANGSSPDPVTPVENGATPDWSRSIPQALLCQQPGSELRYLLSNQQGSLLARLQAHLCTSSTTGSGLVRLRELVTIRRGEELSRVSPLLSQNRPVDGQDWHPVLRGGIDIRPYQVPTGQYWLAGTEIRKPLANYLAPKLLVVKSTGSLQATLDLHGHVVLQTLYVLHLRMGEYPPLLHREESNGSDLAQEQLDELYFLLALLNSQLLREYVYVLHTAYKWVQPQIEQRILAELPVPRVPIQPPLREEKAAIIKRAKLLMCACSQIPPVVELKESKELYEEQERAICRLYETALSFSECEFGSGADESARDDLTALGGVPR